MGTTQLGLRSVADGNVATRARASARSSEWEGKGKTRSSEGEHGRSIGAELLKKKENDSLNCYSYNSSLKSPFKNIVLMDDS